MLQELLVILFQKDEHVLDKKSRTFFLMHADLDKIKLDTLDDM